MRLPRLLGGGEGPRASLSVRIRQIYVPIVLSIAMGGLMITSVFADMAKSVGVAGLAAAGVEENVEDYSFAYFYDMMYYWYEGTLDNGDVVYLANDQLFEQFIVLQYSPAEHAWKSVMGTVEWVRDEPDGTSVYHLDGGVEGYELDFSIRVPPDGDFRVEYTCLSRGRSHGATGTLDWWPYHASGMAEDADLIATYADVDVDLW